MTLGIHVHKTPEHTLYHALIAFASAKVGLAIILLLF